MHMYRKETHRLQNSCLDSTHIKSVGEVAAGARRTTEKGESKKVCTEIKSSRTVNCLYTE
jgi:hypothetical protein